MKDRSDKPRSYEGELMQIGEPGEAYIGSYLARRYVKVIPIGKEQRRRDYRCFLESGKFDLVEGKTDTRIAVTSRVPWEVLRLEQKGMRAYISWGYATQASRVIYFVPQWMKILDIGSADMRKLIFSHLMAKQQELRMVYTLTDEDRITFFFPVPITLLRASGYMKEIDIAELPLTPEIAYQLRLR